MSLRDQLQGIYDSRSLLTPPLVVDEARDPESPLHGYFEWDDGRGGEAYRTIQARHLIQSVTIVYREESARSGERRVRAFHAVTDPATGASRFEPAEKVAEDPLLRQMVLTNMEREWRAFKSRYGHMAEFVALVAAENEPAVA